MLASSRRSKVLRESEVGFEVLTDTTEEHVVMENKYDDYKTKNGLLAHQKQAKLHELFHVEENHLKFLIEVTNFFKEILRTKDDQVYVIDIPENLDKSQIEDFSLLYDICDFHQNSFTHNLRRCQDNALHI